MRAGLVAIAVLIVGAAVVALNALFIVNPTQQALVLQFGEVRQAIREPGLHTKIPFVQNVFYLDRRVLDLNAPAQEIIAADQKRLVVDAFMRYRIANPVRFYQAATTIQRGEGILSARIQSNLRAVLAEATFTSIVRDDRPGLMRRISERVATSARELGVEVVDVKIRRADLPEANSEAIYARMQTEREQEAREIRAQGQEAAQRVRAAADRNATVLRAEANREAEQIRGQGDGRRNAIYADAYGQDPNFFSFYRAMQAYEQSLSADTRLVLSPDAEFFRYFNDPSGAYTPRATTPASLPNQPSPDEPEGDAAPEVGAATGATGSAPADAQQSAAPASDESATLTPAAAQGAAAIGPDSSEAEAAANIEAGDAADEATAAAVETAEPEPSPTANAAANAEVGTEGDPTLSEAEARARIEEGDAGQESTAAAVDTAEPTPSPAANAAANEQVGVGDDDDANERPGDAAEAAEPADADAADTAAADGNDAPVTLAQPRTGTSTEGTAN